MKMSNLSRPSPAIIVACVALSFALVGTAVAGTDGLSQKITKAKVKTIAKKQANKVLKQKASGLSVANAATATSATNATTADFARAPDAYAHVTENGDVNENESRGIADANVTQIGGATSGFYCFTDLPPFKTVQATQHIITAPPADAIVIVTAIQGELPGTCSALGVPNAELTVLTNENGGGSNAEDFDLWLGN